MHGSTPRQPWQERPYEALFHRAVVCRNAMLLLPSTSVDVQGAGSSRILRERICATLRGPPRVGTLCRAARISLARLHHVAQRRRRIDAVDAANGEAARSHKSL